MDQELTGNAFKRFMRRRGLSREKGDMDGDTGMMERTDHPSSSLLHESQLQQRASSTFVRSREPPPRATASASPHPDNVRRTQSTCETAAPQSPPRRQRRQEDDNSKKQYRCEYCNLTFGRKHHKERHVANIHRHVCHIKLLSIRIDIVHMFCHCFFGLDCLWIHRVSHKLTFYLLLFIIYLIILINQEKPYVCNVCGHPFHQKPNLDRHRVTVHSEVTPFRCEDCGMNFSRRGVLRSHIQTVHERSQRHECSICRASFSDVRELSDHVRLEHSSPVSHHHQRGHH